jgi:hypothetical protein
LVYVYMFGLYAFGSGNKRSPRESKTLKAR